MFTKYLVGALHVLHEMVDKALTKVDWRQEKQHCFPAEFSLSKMKFAIALTYYYNFKEMFLLEVKIVFPNFLSW